MTWLRRSRGRLIEQLIEKGIACNLDHLTSLAYNAASLRCLSSDRPAYTAPEDWSVTMPLEDTEEWRPCTRAPETYEVSDFGRVRRALYAPPTPTGPNNPGQM